MATATAATGVGRLEEVDIVDPRAPRFGQTITSAGLLVGIALDVPAFVFAIAIVLNAAVLSRWRLHPYSLAWRHVAARLVDAPDRPEPAAPHRFATVIGAIGTGLASLAILAGFTPVGYVLAAAVAAAAGLGATTGFCLGCHMYRSVSLFRRLSVV